MSLRKVAMWVTVAGPREQARMKKTLSLGWKGCVFGAFVEGTNWRIRCLLKGGVLLIALHLVHVTRALQWCFDDDEDDDDDDDDIPPLQTPEVTTRWLSRGIRGILPKWPWIWVWMVRIYSKSPTCSTHNASDYSSSLQLQMGSDCPPLHHQDFMFFKSTYPKLGQMTWAPCIAQQDFLAINCLKTTMCVWDPRILLSKVCWCQPSWAPGRKAVMGCWRAP